ncbi:MAG: TIGR02301 family protein [Bradyrhizobiaceae bacterium]|nr:TIGR02301 family protein [Bradyrhizobiaceae bacterium]
MQQPQAPAQRAAPAALPDQKQIKIIETPPAYEGEMARLAEILGALHYLRPLCGSKDGSRWRNEMQGLIESEQPPAERRDRMIASFNRSYVAYEQTYRSCTPAADLAIRRFLDEGAKLSREIATRYGN